jgi:glyoxylase-like metal-dependent hydrolase (beta-lactamase superfamily II)
MMKPIAFAIFAAGTLALAGAAQAQQIDYAKIDVKTTDLGHKTYMLEGAGGNVTIAAGADGVIMVDAQFAPMHDKLKAAIAAVTNQPVRYVVNTHFHGDHTGGDEAFAKDGAVVVANVNVKKRLADGSTNGLTGAKTPGVSRQALPSKTYGDAMTLKVKGRTAELHHVLNAHTDGDTYVWFKDANVLSTGDTVTLGRYPNIDFANGGSIDGMIAANDKYLAMVNDKTKIVPGHGPLADKKALKDYRAMLVESRKRIATLIKSGKSEADTVAAKPLADFDTKVGANEQAATNFVRVIYNSLKPAKK